MTKETRRLFERSGPAPKQMRGHIPSITIRGSTVKIVCSCGERLGGGSGYNRSGMDYAISWGKEAYYEHVIQVRQKAVKV